MAGMATYVLFMVHTDDTNTDTDTTLIFYSIDGQTVFRSTLRHLTDKETHCPFHLDTRRVFDETVASHLGPKPL